MANNELRRFTGEVVGRFGEELGRSCDLCSKPAVLLPCNAERDPFGRAHHWGGVHELGTSRNLNLCEDHGIEILANNEQIKMKRETSKE
jgi:hypothetical protein